MSTPPPVARKKAKLSSKQSAGKTYERKVGKAVSRLVSRGHLDGDIFAEQWIQFRDAHGLGHAQPDIYIVQEDRILLLECKLTQTGRAWDQMKKLYVPLLSLIYELPVVSVQVCKNLRFEPDNLIEDLREAESVHTWHFLEGVV